MKILKIIFDFKNCLYWYKRKECMSKVLFLIIPCYNEEDVLKHTANIFINKINNLMNKNIISNDSKVLFIDDGSNDGTWDIIKELADNNKEVVGISHSRNVGHQNAIYSGLMASKDYADITITMDSDGQDDVETIDKMIKENEKGFDVVYGVRDDRKTDSWFKRTSAEIYYKTLRRINSDIVYNHADFRLLSKRIIFELEKFTENNLFMRGIIPLIGFKSTIVYYKRNKRLAGNSKYNLIKMINFSIDGVTNFSEVPLRMITILGMIVSCVSFLFILWALLTAIFGRVVSGWTSLICIISFIGGIQLLCIGVIGEYIGKIYIESKHRPRYIVAEKTGNFN